MPLVGFGVDLRGYRCQCYRCRDRDSRETGTVFKHLRGSGYVYCFDYGVLNFFLQPLNNIRELPVFREYSHPVTPVRVFTHSNSPFSQERVTIHPGVHRHPSILRHRGNNKDPREIRVRPVSELRQFIPHLRHVNTVPVCLRQINIILPGTRYKVPVIFFLAIPVLVTTHLSPDRASVLLSLGSFHITTPVIVIFLHLVDLHS